MTPKAAWISLLLLAIVFYLFSLSGFSRLEHIIGQYYLVAVDTKSDLSIYYKTDEGDYVGRIPNTIIEYGFNDSFLIAKTEDYNNEIHYYIIERAKDFDLAHEENFLTGPLTENEFVKNWKDKQKIKMKTAN